MAAAEKAMAEIGKAWKDPTEPGHPTPGTMNAVISILCGVLGIEYTPALVDKVRSGVRRKLSTVIEGGNFSVSNNGARASYLAIAEDPALCSAATKAVAELIEEYAASGTSQAVSLKLKS